MMNFWMLVLAMLTASVIWTVVGVAIMTSRPFMRMMQKTSMKWIENMDEIEP